MNAAVKPETRLIKHVPAADEATLTELVERGHAVIRTSHEIALRPESKKVGRRFSMAEVEYITKLSKRTLFTRLKNPDFPQGETVGKSRKRLWSLEEVHRIQEIEGIRPHRGPEDKPVVLGVSVFKGGVGKTTMSTNLAQYLSMVGWRVLLVDLDAQGSATGLLGILGDDNLGDDETSLPVFTGEADSVEYAIRKTYWDGLDIIPANLALYGAEFYVARRLIDAATRHQKYAIEGGKKQPEPERFYTYFRQALDKVLDRYDVVIIDTPPSLGFVTTNALYAADALIVPVHPAPLDFSSTVQFFELLKDVVEQINATQAVVPGARMKSWDFLGLLATRFKQEDGYQQQIMNSVRKTFGEYALRNHVVETKVLEGLGPSMKTAYEIETYTGDRRTFQRAMDCLNSTNLEIEQLIRSLWPSQHDALRKELGIS